MYNKLKLKEMGVCHVELCSMNFYMPLALATSKFEETEITKSKFTKTMWKAATGSIMKNLVLGFVLNCLFRNFLILTIIYLEV